MEISLFLIPITISLGFILYSIYELVIGSKYSVHKYMVKSSCLTCGEADFETFKKYFDNTNWEFKNYAPNSLFSYEERSQYHASIIEFNNKGMIIKNSLEYIKVRNYVQDYINENYKQKVEW